MHVGTPPFAPGGYAWGSPAGREPQHIHETTVGCCCVVLCVNKQHVGGGVVASGDRGHGVNERRTADQVS